MILHLANADKFIAPFWELSRASIEGFDGRHQLYVAGFDRRYRVPSGGSVFHADGSKPIAEYRWLLGHLNRAEKIILHGLWDRRVLMMLAGQPWLLERCHWVIWGGDLYHYLNSAGDRLEPVRRFAIRRFGHLVSHVRGDVELARKWYDARGEWHECFMYTSNIFHDHPHDARPRATLNVLAGNSASLENEHEEVFELLRPYADQDMSIYCPLSYGDASYARRVELLGRRMFGEKFIPLTQYMEFGEYQGLLSRVDIAVFGHRIQQALGNATTLLGMGKKVHMRPDLTSSSMYRELGVTVYSLEEFLPLVIDPVVAAENRARIRMYFSVDRLVRQWSAIYG